LEFINYFEIISYVQEFDGVFKVNPEALKWLIPRKYYYIEQFITFILLITPIIYNQVSIGGLMFLDICNCDKKLTLQFEFPEDFEEDKVKIYRKNISKYTKWWVR
jgi:hypothetical protein